MRCAGIVDLYFFCQGQYGYSRFFLFFFFLFCFVCVCVCLCVFVCVCVCVCVCFVFLFCFVLLLLSSLLFLILSKSIISCIGCLKISNLELGFESAVVSFSVRHSNIYAF